MSQCHAQVSGILPKSVSSLRKLAHGAGQHQTDSLNSLTVLIGSWNCSLLLPDSHNYSRHKVGQSPWTDEDRSWRRHKL